MILQKDPTSVTEIKRLYIDLNQELLKYGVNIEHLCKNKTKVTPPFKITYITIAVIFVLCSLIYEYEFINDAVRYIQGVRCVVPNNYFIWEATRPISDCHFCHNVTAPIILPNVTKEEFKKYAYISKPVVVKKAFLHWPAINHFDFNFFKRLYQNIEDSYKSVDEECQFLHFKSDFISLRDVFAMEEARIRNSPGQKSWYVGW